MLFITNTVILSLRLRILAFVSAFFERVLPLFKIILFHVVGDFSVDEGFNFQITIRVCFLQILLSLFLYSPAKGNEYFRLIGQDILCVLDWQKFHNQTIKISVVQLKNQQTNVVNSLLPCKTNLTSTEDY